MSRDVGVGQLVNELEGRGDRLPFEIGAFVALEACEGLLRESVKLEPDDVRVTLEGSVLVADSAERVEPDEAARSLVSVLARLLIAAGPGVPPYLLGLVKDYTTGQTQNDLRRLHDAIEASLIPINRSASRRVLARLVRDSDRPPAAVPGVNPRELDAELDELLADPLMRSLEPEHARLSPRGAQEDQARVEPPMEDLQPDTVPVPPSEPALRSAATVTPHLAVQAVPAVAVGVEESLQVELEPVTATVRKSPEAEPGVDSESVTASVAQPGTEIEPASAREPASTQEPAFTRESVSSGEPVSTRESESPRESASAPESASATEAEPPAITGPGRMSEPQPAEAPEPEPPALTEPGRMSEPQPAEAPEPDAAPAAVPDWVTESRAQSVSATGNEFAAESESAPEIVPDSSLSVEPAETYDRSSLPEPRRPRRSGGWSVWVFAAALGLCAYALIATGTLERLVQALGSGSKPAPTGTIDVTVTPEDAQIFVYVGRGPAVAHGMTVPSAHEFIVFDEGLKPSRAIVPQDATWTTADGGPLYELAVQAHALGDASDVLDLGAPQAEPSPDTRGGTGTIRVITNPPGAKVYRYIGAGPSARIRVPSIHEGQEVLVHREAFETTRAVIGPSDWKVTAGESTHSATLKVELPALAKSAAPRPIED